MKKIKLFAVLAIVLGFASSCGEDFLSTSPTSSYDQAFIFTTTENAISALNGMHKAMCTQYNSRQNQSGYTGMMQLMDVMAEDVVYPARGNGWWINELQWLGHNNENNWPALYPYRFFYKLISNANMIIDNVDAAVGSDSDKNMVKGQAYAYRGMSYFWLVQLYGKRYQAGGDNSGLAVPLVVNTVEIEKGLESVDAVYAQAISDLDQAISFLSATNFARSNVADFNQAIVEGIRARIALTMQDWAAAEQYATAAISHSGASLMSQSQYTSGFNSAANPEWMWGFEMISDQTLYFYGFMAYMSWNFNSSNIRSAPKCIFSPLYNEISDTDIRKTLWDPTGKAWTMPSKSFVKYPYMNRKFSVEDYTSSVADACFMRLGEMYLIAAEAQANQNKNDQAQTNLYTLVHARDNAYTKSTKTGKDLLKEIYIQRRIELWGEGFRWLDLKRLDQPLDRTGGNHVESVSLQMTVPAGHADWKFKIPKNEIDANKMIPETINQ